MGGTSTISVLVVDDEPLIRKTLARMLQREPGTEVRLAGSIAEAERMMGERPPDVVVCDYHLPDGCGPDLVRRTRREQPAIAAVLVSGAPEDLPDRDRNLFIASVPKPVSMEALRRVVGVAAQHRELARSGTRAKVDVDGEPEAGSGGEGG